MNVLYVRRTFAYFLNERIDKIDIKEQNASSARLHKYHKGLLSVSYCGVVKVKAEIQTLDTF